MSGQRLLAMDRRTALVLCAGCALFAAPALSAADPVTDLDPSYAGGGSVSSSSTKTGSGGSTSGGGTVALRRRLAKHSARVAVRATGVDTAGVASKAKARKTLR
jgi:hypothetical protein